MEISIQDGVNTIDGAGTIMFHKNECGIRIDENEQKEYPKLNIMNFYIVGVFKSGVIQRIKECFRLYKFLK